MSAEADTTVHAHLVVILNECLLSAAKYGNIPRLQVLRCVLGPIRALTAKWPTSAAGVAATWRRCRASRPVRLDRPGHRGRFCVGRFAAAICARTFSTGQRAFAFPMWAARFAQTTRTGRDCQ
jgi:hypothetical protein